MIVLVIHHGSSKRCLVAVFLGFVRPSLRDVDVFRLLLGKLGQLRPQRRQMQTRHLLVQLLREAVHLGCSVRLSGGTLENVGPLPVVEQVELRDRLVGERTGHHEGGMTRRAPQVHQPSGREHDHAVAVREDETVHLRLDVLALDTRLRLQSGHVDFVVEVADISHNGVVFHLGHVLGSDDVEVAGCGDEDVALVDDVFDGGHLVPFHARLQGTNRVALRNHDAGAGTLHRHGGTLADITVPGDQDTLAANHHVSGTHEAIRQRVSAPVDVVEFGFGHAVVHVDGRK
mmetsp:Transcript_18936/g.47286  ORF Transcript_18936/g.47286 Transcript_18936/m.47286 type:complete len:287 (+) Transcript_18936:872-1732(+)